MNNTLRILIAEDDSDLQKLFYKSFNHAGFQCALVSEGHHAWAEINDNCPDMLILDLGLPGISGIEILKRIKNSVDLQNLKVIVVSGNHQANLFAVTDRADLVMVKPVSPRDLVRLTERFTRVNTSLE